MAVFSRSSFIHLRIHFSLFLLPIYIFAIASVQEYNWFKALIIFFIWHLFVYPASNAFNSYYDRDEGSIGGLKSPPPVRRDLYWLATLFDAIGIGLSFLISPLFAAAVVVYILISRAYSHPAVRLKNKPFLSWLTIGLFQGSWVYFFTYISVSDVTISLQVFEGAVISALMLWGLYPITQIYQHEEDRRRGDITISIKMGIRGTFVISGIFIGLAGMLLLLFIYRYYPLHWIWILMATFLPVVTYFMYWYYHVTKGKPWVDFSHTMTMNVLSSASLLLFFGLLLLFT